MVTCNYSCYVDSCVPPGTYQYGYGTPYVCASSDYTAYFVQLSVTQPLGTCASDAGAPMAVANAPWKSAEITMIRDPYAGYGAGVCLGMNTDCQYSPEGFISGCADAGTSPADASDAATQSVDAGSSAYDSSSSTATQDATLVSDAATQSADAGSSAYDSSSSTATQDATLVSDAATQSADAGSSAYDSSSSTATQDAALELDAVTGAVDAATWSDDASASLATQDAGQASTKELRPRSREPEGVVHSARLQRTERTVVTIDGLALLLGLSLFRRRRIHH